MTSNSSINKPNLQSSETSLNTSVNLQSPLAPVSPLEALLRVGNSSSLAFVDTSVSNYESLIQGITPGTEVHILKAGQDAVTQITEVLLRHQGISSLHIFSHGSAGSLDFASSSLNAYNIRGYTEQLQVWGNALKPNADILLYGCNVAENALGKTFVELIHQITGADIAASNDLTGNTTKGGDWELEYKAGRIESSVAIISNGIAQYTNTLKTPILVGNLNNTTSDSNAGSNPTNLVNVNGTLYFSADDGINGTELWRLSPGSSNPTLVQNINMNAGFGSNPANLTNVNGILYFTADDGIYGSEIWRIEANGNPIRLRDINNRTNAGSNASNFTNVNGTLYFTANDGIGGTELWKIDGAGTLGTIKDPILVRDINTRSGVGSNPSNLINVNNVLYFTADDGIGGTELWRLDTLSNPIPSKVTEIRNGEAGSNAANLTNVSGTLYFTADNGNSGNELWKLDAAGSPVLVQDINSLLGAGSNPSNLTHVNGTLYFTANDKYGVSVLMRLDTLGQATSVVSTTSSYINNPLNLTDVNGTLYFTANDGAKGTELWRIDTSGKAVQVADIAFSVAGSDPSNLINVNGTLFFTADDGVGGRELWRLTSGSTTPTKSEINNLPVAGSNPSNLTNVNGTLYFTADDGKSGIELWRVDESSSPMLVRDIRTTRNVSSNPSNITDVNGTIYFTADDGTCGNELWQLDASGNPVLVEDIHFMGAGSSNPSNLTNVNGILYFTANDGGMSGTELWKLEPGNRPVRVMDINPSAASSNPSNLTNVNGKLYFTADRGIGVAELWVIDKPNVNPVRVMTSNLVNPSNLINVAGILYFTADDGMNGRELCRLAPNGSPYLINIRNRDAGGSNPSNLTSFGDTLYFTADDGINGTELWRITPTSSNPQFVSSGIRPGNAGSNPSNLTNVNGTLYFCADGIGGTELFWINSFGSINGREIAPGDVGSNPSDFISFNGALYFAADDGISGRELWRLDTSGNLFRVTDLNPSAGSSNPSNLMVMGNNLYFTAFSNQSGRELWRVDSLDRVSLARNIRDGGSSDPSNLVNINGTIYFVADDGVYGRELWRLDENGNSAMIRDIRNNSGIGSNPSNFIDVNGTLYFTAIDGINGTELWRLRPGEIRPSIVKNINSQGSSNPSNLINVNETLYFTADDGMSGTKLWRIDAEGMATLVRDINTLFKAGSNPSNLTDVNGTLYFTANDGVSGNRLWQIDSSGKAIPILDINSNLSVGFNPSNLTNINGTLYFTSDDGNMGRELWRIDSTGRATLVRDINTLYKAGSNPSNLTNVNGILYFTANDGINGTELWRIDGTGNAVLVRDINASYNSSTFTGNGSNPSNLTNVNGTLYFTADDGNIGRELWRIDGTGNPVLVRNINTFLQAGSNPLNLTNFNGTLYFSAHDGNSRQLWRIDQMGNAVMLAITNFDANPSNFTIVNNVLYFTANNNSSNNVELWRVTADTFPSPVGEIRTQDNLGSFPSNLTNVDGILYFTAEDGISGTELWRLDATGKPVLVQNIRSIDAGGSNPSNLININGTLYFAANDGINGTELWKVVHNTPPTTTTVTKSGNEDTTITFSVSDFTTKFSDPDGNTLTKIKITSLPTNGELKLGSYNVTLNQEIITFDITNLTFKPNANFNGNVTFTWNGSDGRNYAVDNGSVIINVNPVNDAPVVSSISKFGNEDNTINFSSSDFGSQFTDIDGNNLSKIKITSLPTNGILKLSGADITLNQEIAATDIVNLTFTPGANFNGTINFSWNASDGSVYAAKDSTLTLTINPINDTPVLGNISKSGSENSIISFSASDFTSKFTDIDGDNLAKIRISSLPQNGTLKFNGVNVTLNQEIDVALISQLTFTPAPNYKGTTSFRWNGYDGASYSTTNATVSLTINPNSSNRWEVVAGGDFDDDGKQDILQRNFSTGGVRLASADGNPSVFQPSMDINWSVISTADFTGDNKADILWRNMVTGENRVWQMDGANIVSNSATFRGTNTRTNADLNWQVVSTSDFTGDGKADILWRHVSTGETIVWQMNGANIVSFSTTFQGTNTRVIASNSWQVISTSDFTGDKKADILWRNSSTGETIVWQMDGARITSLSTTFQGTNIRSVASLDWQVISTVDFNNDGKADILWRSNSTGETRVWNMDGARIVANSATMSNNQRLIQGLNWRVISTTDFNNDGNADILWRNTLTGETQLWEMDLANIVANTVVSGAPTPEWQLFQAANFYGDSKLDSLWVNSNNQAKIVQIDTSSFGEETVV
ncbi:hypothetical protein NIES2101_15965 [Calothrix sp. HK-06]|nr:hypothetical protein NIES2101_15965 [Calothrix sp. HK-06]